MTTADLGPRLNLRRKTQLRSRLRRIVLLVAALAVIIGLVWVALFSTVLETREVEVTGTQIITAQQVIEVAQVPIGTPLTRIPAAAIKQRVLSLPAVAEVELHRNWPHTLGIEITERSLVYQRVDGDRYQWVDADGHIFHATAEPGPSVVAQVAGGDQRLLADVATVVAALPAEVIEQTERLEASSVDSIVVLLVDGRTIVWGNASQSAEKAALLPTLLAIEGTSYDVSVPSHPAVR